MSNRSQKKAPKNRPLPVDRLDFRMIAHQGRCFVDMARPLLKDLRVPVNLSARSAGFDLGPVVCTATVLTLGIELLMKAIHVGRQLPLPDTHNLLALYRGIPHDVQEAVLHGYEARRSAWIPTDAIELEIEMVETGKSFPKTKPSILDRSLVAVLQRSADAFVAWRYFYESVPYDRAHAMRAFEHGPLSDIADALIEFISVNTRDGLYKMHANVA